MGINKHGFGPGAKYKIGELLRHKKHNYIVKLLGRSDIDWKVKIKLIKGPIPINSFIFASNAELGEVGFVAHSTLNKSFESLGPGAEILFSEE